MRNIAVFNIGNRDLYFTEPVEIMGETINDVIKNKSKYRELTEYIFEHYKEFEGKINFPIVEKTLYRLVRRNKINLHEIILVTSNQDIAHPTDTIFVAKILQQYLIKLKNVEKFKEILKETKKASLYIINKNPSDMDIMNEFYSEKLKRFKSDSDYSKAYLSLTSGTPAMNMMLLLNGINYFKNKVEVLYLPNDSEHPRELKIGKELLKQNYIDSIRENIEVYDYYAALKLLENHKSEFSTRDTVGNLENLLTYAHNRLSFNFEEAEDNINEVLDNSPHHREAVEVLYDQIYELADSDDEHTERMMTELYWNMWLLYQRGQFIDVVGRIFRFQEEALKLILERKLNLPINRKQTLDRNWLNGQPELKRFLSNYKGIAVDVNRPLTRLSMQALIEFYIENGRSDISLLLKAANTVEKLAELRNKLILAHGWKGCSEQNIFDSIYENLGITEPSQLPQAFFSLLKGQLLIIFEKDELVEKNIYEEINKTITAFINELE